MSDSILWDRGEEVAKHRGRQGKAWELDFLRGMHAEPALQHLATHLSNNTGRHIQLSSIWLDKHAWVSWTDENGKRVSKRELADLAVIVRRPSGRSLSRWMWLLQGKRIGCPLETYSGTSSPYEVDLLQRMPPFNLRGTNFDLQTRDFDPTVKIKVGSPWNIEQVFVPWTFLDFPDSKTSSRFTNHPLIAPRWLGGMPKPGWWANTWLNGAVTQRISSYTECLLSIVTGQAPVWWDPRGGSRVAGLVPGAPIHKRFPTWKRLYQSLMSAAVSSTSGHAVSKDNPTGAVLQVSKFIANFSHAPFLPWLYAESLDSTVSVAGHAHGGDCSDFFERRCAFGQRVKLESDYFQASHDVVPPLGESIEDEPGGMLILFVDILSPPKRRAR
ncbi:hypothetical protein LMG7141_04122 [Ralstonia condita]|uniref:Uncharacterized protein n=2 Tax=Ralstonia TaxID=48736 RepID=A0ABM9JT72_9RALS|nr:hypothetical protein [Ralstonia sp. LMG 7141]CAJ0802528.1 hypothetical protein LMG7141_04122 [Ralstonia sp. LMG 7141]